MSLEANYTNLLESMKALYKDRDLSEDEWVEHFCNILQTHLLAAQVSTVLSGTAGPNPINGIGSGGLL